MNLQKTLKSIPRIQCNSLHSPWESLQPPGFKNNENSYKFEVIVLNNKLCNINTRQFLLVFIQLLGILSQIFISAFVKKKYYLNGIWIVSFFPPFLAWFLKYTFLGWKFDHACVSRLETGKSQDGVHLLMVQRNYIRGVFQLKRLNEYSSVAARIKREEQCKTAFELKYKGRNLQIFCCYC